MMRIRSLAVLASVLALFAAPVLAVAGAERGTRAPAERDERGAGVPASTENTKKSVLKVSGMSCGSCVSTVKKAATKVEGVADAVVSLEKGEAEVSFDPAKVTPEDIAKAITKAGFKTEPRK
jgi:copper ion binding protein